MNLIWTLLTIAALLALMVQNPALALPAMISASNEALKLTISLVAVYALWMGVMELLDKSGLSDKLARLLKPVVRRLFPDVSEQSTKYICLNLSANVLGLGSAATPLGIKAMESMDDLSGTATRSMILLAIINSTSLQLIPTTILGMRAAAGSSDPAGVLLPSFLSGVVSLTVGITLAVLISRLGARKSKRNQRKGQSSTS